MVTTQFSLLCHDITYFHHTNFYLKFVTLFFNIGRAVYRLLLGANDLVPCFVVRSLHLYTLQWRHNDQDGVSNHQPRGCLLNRLFRRRSKKTSKLRVTGLCVGNSPGPVNSLHKGPVTWKMFPFDDVIMIRSFPFAGARFLNEPQWR